MKRQFFVLANSFHSRQTQTQPNGRVQKGFGSGGGYVRCALMYGKKTKAIRNTRKTRIVKSRFPVYIRSHYDGAQWISGKSRNHANRDLIIRWKEDAKQYNRFPAASCAINFPEVLKTIGKRVPPEKRNHILYPSTWKDEPCIKAGA